MEDNAGWTGRQTTVFERRTPRQTVNYSATTVRCGTEQADRQTDRQKPTHQCPVRRR